jgi:hypothetical protein
MIFWYIMSVLAFCVLTRIALLLSDIELAVMAKAIGISPKALQKYRSRRPDAIEVVDSRKEKAP